MKKIVFLMVFVSVSLVASDLRVAVVAGYKKPILKVVDLLPKKNIELLFGNIKQVISYAKNSKVDVIIGDKEYLVSKSKLDISRYVSLGKGTLVLAYAKGKSIGAIDSLKDKNISKIAMTHPKKTTYGKATKEFLSTNDMYEDIKDKLYIVSTLPQVATYLVSKNIDFGFINKTLALALKDKIGGYIKIDQKYYTPVKIVAIKLKNSKHKEVDKFLNFLESKKAKKIFYDYGL